MAEPGAAPTVALLFADKDLGEHLREALTRLGARIVHEGPAAQVRKEVLAASGADVVVVNLEPDEEDHLDQLYELLEEKQQRVVFNDAEVTRNLSGWDRARWARHLAAKLLGSDDVDPPRPEGARSVDVTAAHGEDAVRVVADDSMTKPVAEAALEADPLNSEDAVRDTQVDVPNTEPPPVEPAEAPVVAELAQTQTSDTAEEAIASESLEAELEALLEKDDAVEMDETAAQKPLLVESFEDMELSDENHDLEVDESSAETIHDEDIQSLNLDSAEFDISESLTNESSASAELEPPPAQATAETEQSLQGLSLVDLEATEDAEQDSPGSAESDVREIAAQDSSANAWDLVSMDLEPPPPPIEQVTVDQVEEDVDATDPITEVVAQDSSDSGLNLELVALDVAAPVRDGDEPVSEMLLDSGAGKLRHVTVLAAGSAAIPEVAEFLEALPARFGSLILVVQHQAGQRAEALAEALNETSPVRVQVVGEQATMVRAGQVWLVPSGYRCQLGHGGRLSLEIDSDMAAGSPSVDHCLEPLAKTFGAQLTAIVLSGQGGDAAAGVAMVSARGGEVWVQDPDACGAGSMAEEICKSGLSVHIGSPDALAKKLCEDHA